MSTTQPKESRTVSNEETTNIEIDFREFHERADGVVVPDTFRLGAEPVVVIAPDEVQGSDLIHVALSQLTIEQSIGLFELLLDAAKKAAEQIAATEQDEHLAATEHEADDLHDEVAMDND